MPQSHHGAVVCGTAVAYHHGMAATIIAGKWFTTVSATATGNIVVTQGKGKARQVIVFPAEYKLAICNAIHQAQPDPQPEDHDAR